MRLTLRSVISAVVPATVVAAIAAGSCAREGDAQTAARAEGARARDSAVVARLLNVVRGADPLVCEMATRNVDMHGSWSRWGPFAGDPLTTDSASAEILDQLQSDHEDASVIPRLSLSMRDPDACVRRVSASFLGRIRDPGAAAALAEALDDPSADTRRVAALGLGMTDSVVAVEPLMRRLHDESAAVRRAAAWALGSMEARPALGALIDLLARDPDAQVRQAAAWAIGEMES